MSDRPNVAFYFPGVIWEDASWVKSLTLFFDEVGLLVPDYMKDRPFWLDPAIAEGLRGAGLLRILSPEKLIDKPAAEALATQMAEVLLSGALDELAPTEFFHELSMSRMGYAGDDTLGRMLFDELQQRGLARASEDGVSIPMHPLARELILTLLAQILREGGEREGVDLSPATDRPDFVEALLNLLRIGAPTPGGGDVVSLDLEAVGADLGPVGMDELLAFRDEHGAEFRAYARRLREVVREISIAEDPASVLADRQEEMRDTAQALRSGPLSKLGAAATVGLGIAGGVASVAEGSPVGGILSAAAAAGGAAMLKTKTVTPYSYLFSIQRTFG